MKKISIVALAAAALLTGAVVAREATGGNFVNNVVNANTQYFSVTVPLNQYLIQTCDRRMVIDDITYSVDYVPCDAYTTCDYFTLDDIPDQQAQGLPQSGPSVPHPMPTSGIGMSAWNFMSAALEYVRSKHQWSEVALVPGDGQTFFTAIDAFSLGTYGELALRSYTWRAGFSWIQAGPAVDVFPGPDPSPVTMAAGAGGDGVAIAHSMPMALSSVATSGSRHFQTPPQVGSDVRVYFKITAGSASAIQSGTAFVRGRSFAQFGDPPDHPVNDNCVVVGGP